MRTITFYSYKGGTGRTLAVANAARFLARFGRHVFVLDFDLEAPGLHYKLGLDHSRQRELRGVVDFVTDFKETGVVPDIAPYVYEVKDPEFEWSGSIHLMPAGNAPSAAYSRKLSAIEWHELFNPAESDTSVPRIPVGVPLFLELKARIENSAQPPDFLLIDSRTGVTEIGGVAVRLMPDTVVCLVHSNNENIYGARRILRSVLTAARLPGKAKIDVVPILTRLPEMDPQREAQVLDRLSHFFSDNGANPELAQVIVLHSDPNLQIQEALLVNSQITPNDSVLLRDYYKLFRRLCLDDGMPDDARAVLTGVVAADANPRLRSLLPGRRRSGLDLLAEPVSIRGRMARRNSRLMKSVDATYADGKAYLSWSHVVRRLLAGRLSAMIEKIPSEAVRWDLVAVQLREGVLDFCGEPYLLTDNRSHLVEIVQLGWCKTFGAYVRTDSATHQNLRLESPVQSFAERMAALLRSVPGIEVGVLGETAAASEANRILSGQIETARLIAKSTDKELFKWLEENDDHERIAICDHSVIPKLNELDEQKRYVCDVWFDFQRPIPTGLAYPREDADWRKELARAIAHSFLDCAADLKWDPQNDFPRSVVSDLRAAGIEALSFEELCSSLTLDLPFEEAIGWRRALQKIAASGTSFARQEPGGKDHE
jgi:cellulose biosynthesis protein BcsQ